MTFFDQGFSYITTVWLRESQKLCFPLIQQIYAVRYKLISDNQRNLRETANNSLSFDYY
jgi:hypothetical protein